MKIGTIGEVFREEIIFDLGRVLVGWKNKKLIGFLLCSRCLYKYHDVKR